MFLFKGVFLGSPATGNTAQSEAASVAQLAVSAGPQGLFFFQFCVVF
jgi:hypothetical protein